MFGSIWTSDKERADPPAGLFLVPSKLSGPIVIEKCSRSDQLMTTVLEFLDFGGLGPGWWVSLGVCGAKYTVKTMDYPNENAAIPNRAGGGQWAKNCRSGCEFFC